MIHPASEDHDTEMPDQENTPLQRPLPGDEAPWPTLERLRELAKKNMPCSDCTSCRRHHLSSSVFVFVSVETLCDCAHQADSIAGTSLQHVCLGHQVVRGSWALPHGTLCFHHLGSCVQLGPLLRFVLSRRTSSGGNSATCADGNRVPNCRILDEDFATAFSCVFVESRLRHPFSFSVSPTRAISPYYSSVCVWPFALRHFVVSVPCFLQHCRGGPNMCESNILLKHDTL